jgi:UDP-glucose 4-epimerase
MTEIMLRGAALAHDFHYVTLRYFNVSGADPRLKRQPRFDDLDAIVGHAFDWERRLVAD